MTTNITVSLRATPDGATTERLLDTLGGLSAAIFPDDFGRTGIHFTLKTDSAHDAIHQAFDLLHDYQIVSIEAIPSDEFDLRESGGLDLSVTEAAEILGISRQAVLKRIAAGTLIATKVGTVYKIPRFAVMQLKLA